MVATPPKGPKMSRIVRIADSGSQGDTIDALALIRMGTGLDGSTGPWPYFHVTAATRADTGRLQLVLWRTGADGAITRVADSGDQAGQVDLVAGLAMASGRLLTAVRSAGTGRLKLILWRVTPGGDGIERVADSGAQAGQVDLIRLPPGDGASPIVTAVRSTRTGRLKLILWDVSANQISRVADSADQAGKIDLLAFSSEVGGPLGGTSTIITGVRGQDSQRHRVIAWQVGGNSIERLADDGSQAGDIELIAPRVATAQLFFPLVGSPFITAVQGAAGHMRLIGWELTSGPSTQITRAGDSGNQAGNVDMVELGAMDGPHLVAAVRSRSTGRLKVIQWRYRADPRQQAVLEPLQYHFQRLGDSGAQAGRIDRLAIDGGTAGYPLWTAVRSTASQRLKLIAWSIAAG
jgi:hypothetical protein